MTEKSRRQSEISDDRVLQEMMERADQLCESSDMLLRGQYEHLRGRIQALLSLRCADDLTVMSR